MSFTPEECAESIRKHIPDFKLDFAPDFRQGIAESWPQVLIDDPARKDWGWQHEYDLDAMTTDMLNHLRE